MHYRFICLWAATALLFAVGAKAQGPPAGVGASARINDLETRTDALENRATTRQIATLKWYQAASNITFPTGATPVGVAFDGDNMWVANSDDDTVTKLRASDGETLGTFAVGNTPRALAFDGANIWVGTTSGLTKVRASDGFNLGTFAPGGGPADLAFDGTHIWATRPFSGSVTKLRASDGVVLGTFSVDFPVASGVLLDGTAIWVSGGSRLTKL